MPSVARKEHSDRNASNDHGKELARLRVRQSDPRLWRNFSYEKTSKTSKFRELLICNFVSLSIPANRTHRDVVKQIARESHIPVDRLCDDLDLPVFPRGQAIFGYPGDEFDQIADNYDNMQWWVSDTGLNMTIVKPAHTPHIPTFDELMLGTYKPKKLVSRNQRYKAIDEALQQIAQIQPRTQKQVFQSLDERSVVLPPAEPFVGARGWMAGFRRNERVSRSWLSKRWRRLDLPRLPPGPKSPKK